MIRPVRQLLSGACAAALIFGGALPPVMASAQTATSVRVDLASSSGQKITLARGASAEIDLPFASTGATVGDATVVSAVPMNPSHFTLIGAKVGRTTVSIHDATGRSALNLDVVIQPDVDSVHQAVLQLVPGFRGQVVAVGDGYALTGSVDDATQAKKAEDIARAFAGKDGTVIDNMTIASPQMVTVKVQIVEVQRSVVKQLGFDTSALLGQIGGPQYSLMNAAGFGVNGSLLGGLTGGYKTDTTQQPVMTVPCAGGVTGTCTQIVKSTNFPSFDANGNPITIVNGDTATGTTTVGSHGLNQASAMIKAFERNGLFRTIAEPTVTTLSGETGSLTSGGSFPVPTGRDNTGNVTIDFKEYGVRLQVTPVVLSNGDIQLKTHAEISDLSSIGAFTLGAGNTSLTVPSLVMESSDNVTEMPSGGALMISSLMKQVSKETIDSLPGLGQLPGPLGTLLRSRDYQQGDTEMVMILTPVLARATDPSRLQTPADNLTLASDMDTVLLGRLNQPIKRAADSLAEPYQGPIGYVIE